MPGANQITCITLGIGSHGKDCCPHIIWGVRITGSNNTLTNNLNSSKAMHSIGFHTCPHCPINMCITGSPDTFINNLPHARLGDVVTEFCGTGYNITCSHDHFVNGM